MVVAISTPCIVGYLFSRISRIERIIAVIWLVGAVITLYGVGSRTGLIATFVGVIVAVILALLAYPTKPLKRWIVWAQQNHQRAVAIGIAAFAAISGVLFIAFQLQSGRPAQDDGGGRMSFFRSALDMARIDPILGAGPGGFLQHEVLINSVPPVQPFAHAHNILLTALAESGGLGLIGLFTLLITSVLTCWIAWHQSPQRRRLFAGVIGGLCAFLAFGMLDSPTIQPVAFFMVALLLGYIAAGIPAQRYTTGLRAGLITAPAILIVSLCVYTLRSYNVQWRTTGPDNALISHEESARQLDEQVTNDPSDGLMRLQSAYHWGWAATAAPEYHTPQALTEAIRHFENAINYDPQLGIHRLNLAVLYLQAGLADDALFSAQGAVQRTPEDPLAQLTMAIMQENDSATLSSQAYTVALTANPYWMFAEFWNETTTRRDVRNSFKTTDAAAYYVNLEAGEYDKAWAAAKNDNERNYVLGVKALTVKDLSEAQRFMKQVTLTGSGDVQVDAFFALGDIASQQGNRVEMLRNYWAAYRMIATRGMSGYNSLGDYGYSMIAFNRYGKITDYLPTVPRLDVSPERAKRLKALAIALLANEQFSENPVSEAINIYRLIVQSNPSDREAENELKKLSMF
jgi:tetratricopeptide (TPR) repeat protein